MTYNSRKPHVNNPNYPNTRKLVNIPKLCDHYAVDTIYVPYIDNEELKKLPIPIAIDLIIKLKIFIAYDTQTEQIILSDTLKSPGNYWITQLLDDHKNRRIDLTGYLYD